MALEYVPNTYCLRWRFDFAGKPEVFGMWDSAVISAWNQNKEGLVRASIEGKHRGTKQTIVLAECDGHDFRNFQWLAVSKVNPGMSGSVTPVAHNIGAKILTTSDEILVLNDGHVVRRPLTEGEKSINFATFGR